MKDISHPICTMPLKTSKRGILDAASMSKPPPAAFPKAQGSCRTAVNQTSVRGASFCHLRSRYNATGDRPSTTAGTQ